MLVVANHNICKSVNKKNKPNKPNHVTDVHVIIVENRVNVPADTLRQRWRSVAFRTNPVVADNASYY